MPASLNSPSFQPYNYPCCSPPSPSLVSCDSQTVNPARKPPEGWLFLGRLPQVVMLGTFSSGLVLRWAHRQRCLLCPKKSLGGPVIFSCCKPHSCTALAQAQKPATGTFCAPAAPYSLSLNGTPVVPPHHRLPSAAAKCVHNSRYLFLGPKGQMPFRLLEKSGIVSP